MKGYFDHIKVALSSMTEGLKLTFRYLFEARTSRKPIGIADETYFDVDQGIVTLQYPHESFPVPDNGRYRLHNEIDDCIVCDKCAKVCPVDCIEIDAIKSPEVFGETSDGTPKRIHAAKFDIDMSKCCFCGLCTAVCPTECLTMTKAYDFSEFDVADHVYSFADMNLADIAQKRKDLEAHEIKKARVAQMKASAALPKVGVKPVMKPKVAGAKPVMKPKIGGAKPVIKPKSAGSVSGPSDKTTPARPVMKPKVAGVKPVVKPRTTSSTSESSDKATPPRPVMKPKPVIKPKMDASSTSASKANDEPDSEAAKPKPKFRPRPMIPKKPKPKDGDE